MSYICPFLDPLLPPLAPQLPTLASSKLGRNEHTASFPLKILLIKRRGEELLKYLDVLHKLSKYDIVGILPPFRSLNFRGGHSICVFKAPMTQFNANLPKTVLHFSCFLPSFKVKNSLMFSELLLFCR